MGPAEICKGIVSKNVENFWQFSKIYDQHLNFDGSIKFEEYLNWAKNGWNDSFAHRYPIGKGIKPKFSVKLKLDDQNRVIVDKQLSYIEARKELYIPSYLNAVKNTDAFKMLQWIYSNEDRDLYLKDFDGYNHKSYDMSYDEVINCEQKKMGHAFVLAVMLEGLL